MAIRIKRSSGDTAPSLLESGQLAYVEGSTNGGTLYYGEIGGTVRPIAGKKYVDKLNGIEAGAQVNAVTSVAGRTGAITLGVADVTNAESTANKGTANGYASLDSTGKVPSTQLPSYVDDVLEYNDLASFPATGTAGIIYVAQDTNKTYRWSGSTYVEISASPGSTDAVTEGSTNLYFTQSRARQSISVTDSGGDGSLSYDNSTGVITYTGPSASDVRAHFSAGTAISITNGEIAFTGIQATGNELENVVEDTTPQLGGALDVNGQEIVSVSNGAIVFAPNGSGNIVLNKEGTGLVVARRTAASGTSTNAMFVQRNYTADTLSNMDGHTAGLVFSQRDSGGTQAFYTRLAGEYATDGGHAHWFEKSTNNGTSWVRQATITDNQLVLGPLSGTTTQQFGTYAVQDLAIGTNAVNGNVGGVIFIEAGANGGIELNPDGTGHVSISGLVFPNTDGSANQVLKTDGAGNLSWVTQTAGVTAFTGLSDVPASYSGAGGYYVKVNSGASALEFSQHVDDGTF